VPSFVVGTIGAVALLAAGLLAIDGHVERANLRSNCAPNCDESDVDRIRTVWVTAAIVGVVGAVALGVSVLLWPGSKSTSAASRVESPFSIRF
jgi:hypothetical protein